MKILKQNLRPLIYALSISLAIYIASTELFFWNNYKNFILFFLVSVLLYFVETILIWIENSNSKENFLGKLEEGKDSKLRLSNVYAVPIILINLSVVLGGLVNIYFEISNLLIVSFLIFTTLKTLTLYFKEQSEAIINVNLVFDLLKIYTLFILISLFSIVILTTKENHFDLIAMFILIAVFLTWILIYKLNFSIYIKLALEAFSVSILAALLFLLTYLQLPALVVAVYIMIIYVNFLSAVKRFEEDHKLEKEEVFRITIMILLSSITLVLFR